MYEYPVLGVREIHDGDTFRLDLDMGFEHSAWPWLRLKGYSCPELHDLRGYDALAFTRGELTEGLLTTGIWVRTHKKPGYEDTAKTLTRYLAEVYFGKFLDESDPLGKRLVAAGLATVGAHVG